MSSFFESRLGKRQFDCSEAEYGLKASRPLLTTAQYKENEEKGLALL